MNFLLKAGGDVNVVLAFKDTEEVNKGSDLFKFLKEKKLFKGSEGEVYTHLSKDESFVFLGLGDEKKLNFQSLRKSFFLLGEKAQKLNITSLSISVPRFGDLCYTTTIKSLAEGLIQSQYSFEKFKSDKKEKTFLEDIYLEVLEEKREKVEAGLKEIETIMEGVFITRDLVNEPAMNMYPETLAKAAVDNLSSLGIDVKVYGQKEIEEMDMIAFLAVSKGSEKEPKFIVMNYKGDPSSEEKLALVGKGLTYDSGGYSIKTAEGMATMHSDMAGSASVIGALYSIAKAGIKKNVIGIVAACENMISGGAYKTGDIIGSMSGKTIEVGNTDAEGRITLADALWYAATVEKANKIVDLATLTGACVVALGSINTGAITNDESLMDDIREAAKISGEPVWELPHDEEYKELFKSHFADLKNTGGRWAGAITAGMFLQEFVNDTPWVHLDIAGTSFISGSRGYLPKGATGVPVKTLFNLVKNM